VNFTLNATDAPAFQPNTLTGAHAGDAISVKIVNTGRFNHTFTLTKTPGIQLNTSWSPEQLEGWFRTNGSLANVSVGPGATAWANFSIPANATGGTFLFLSLVPYQYQSGMKGTLVVSAGAPTASLTEQATAGLQFVPSVLAVNATHYPITIEVAVTDVGALVHSWTLNPLANVTLTPGNFSSFFASHAPAANLLVSSAGQTVNATFTLNGPGIYQYICTQPGHFQGGMAGSLYVGVAPPAPVQAVSTGIVQAGILAAAGALVVIAAVVAFASNYVGRVPPPSGPRHP
jgi:uncharacterized cupredoxin-like copper-binding protein